MNAVSTVLAVVLVSLATVNAETAKSTAPPRVFLLEMDALQATRQRVQNGDPELASAVEKLRRDAKEAMTVGPFSVVDKEATPPSGDKHDYMSMAPYFWPNPDTADKLPYIRRDGKRNPEIYTISDRMNLSAMVDAAETLALAYYLLGDEAYAARAAELLRVWFLAPDTRMNPHLQYAQFIRGVNTGRGIGLIEMRELVNAVDVIGLLGGAKSWTEADQRGAEEWFAKYLQWMLESEPGRDEADEKNNHGTFYDFQVVSFALFLGNTALATETLQAVGPKRIAVQVEPDGRQPLELVRTKAWGYSTGNLRGLMMLARFGEHVGVDLWSYESEDGRSIRKAIDFLAPFGLGEKKWPYLQLGEWQPELFYPILRRAAVRYPKSPYREMLAKLPSDPAEKIDLLRWKLPRRDPLKD